jgi:hypothetical protein
VLGELRRKGLIEMASRTVFIKDRDALEAMC